MPRSVDTFLTVDAQGRVGADFQGHISAAGIDMISGSTVSPPSDRKIIWHKDTLTGAYEAEIFAYDSAGGGNLVARAEPSAAGLASSAIFAAAKLDKTSVSYLAVAQDEAPAVDIATAGLFTYLTALTMQGNANNTIGEVDVNAVGQSRVLLDQASVSEYLQCPAADNVSTFAKRFELVGPIFVSMGADIASGAQQQITVNIPDISWATSAVTFGNLSDGGFAAQFSVRVDYPSSSSVRFTLLNHGPAAGRANYASYIIASTANVFT